jgi:spore coat protein CotH
MLQGADGKRNGLASAMGIEFVYVHADLDFQGHQLKDVGVRYKGNGTFLESRGSVKRSLKIDLNHYVKGQRLGDVVVLNLQNNVTDASWMNEVLSYQLYRDAGVPAPRTSYARVYVTVPGKYERQYLGLYSLSENVDKNFAAHRFGTRRGAIFKPVTANLFDDLGPEWATYNQTYDPKTELYAEHKKAIMDLCQLVTHASDTEFAVRIGHYIDLPEFARFMAVMVYLSDLDGILGPGQNFYLHLHPKTQLFEFIPWDQDHSFGQMPRASQEQRDNLSILKPWQNANRMPAGMTFLERVFKVDAFRELYLARIDEFSRTIFRPERLAEYVDEIAAAIRPAVEEESEAKLARFDQAVAGEMLTGGGFGPFGGGPGIKPIKPFAQARAKSIVAQVAGEAPGQTLDGPGFPGPGGGGRGPGGPEGFGPGMFLGGVFLQQLDQDKDSRVTRDEFMKGFRNWFETWDTDHRGRLTEQQLRAGIDKDLSPFRGGMPGFGGPPGAPGTPPGGPDDKGGGL